MRCFSILLFVAMSAVLPLAGVQRYFCTMNMEFLEAAEDCPIKGKNCCGEKRADPDCMASAKLLPNADKSSPLHVPAAGDVWAMVPALMEECSPTRCVDRVFPEKERGPPDRTRLFLSQRRLLI